MERLLLDVCLTIPVAVGAVCDWKRHRIPRGLGLLYVWGGLAVFVLRRFGPSWSRTTMFEAVASLLLAMAVFCVGYAARRSMGMGDTKAFLYVTLAFTPRQALCTTAVSGLILCIYAWATGDVFLLGGIPRSKSGRRYPFLPFLLAGLAVGLAVFR